MYAQGQVHPHPRRHPTVLQTMRRCGLDGRDPESAEARRADWRRYKKDHLTPGEAMVLDTTWHHKLRTLN